MRVSLQKVAEDAGLVGTLNWELWEIGNYGHLMIVHTVHQCRTAEIAGSAERTKT